MTDTELEQQTPETEASVVNETKPAFSLANMLGLKRSEDDEAADGKKKKRKKTWQQELTEWIVTLAAALLIAFVVRSFIFEPVYVDGDSMYPTLHHGEIMYVSKTAYGTSFFGIPGTNIGTRFTVGGDPERFDVVVCHYNDGDYNVVKRVVGLPGDTIELKDGCLYVNGVRYEEKFLHEPIRSSFGPVTVPEGHYFLMGDNRNSSKDSRQVGPVSRDEIVGRVEAVIWHVVPNTLEDYGKKSFR